MDTQMKVLKCAEVEIRVFAGGERGALNYVSMKDVEAEKKLRDREKKRKKSRPGPCEIRTQLPKAPGSIAL
jgi:hypothetical protein